LRGYLIIDDISIDEAKKLMNKLRKKGRWFSEKAMAKIDYASAFAMLTHDFPKVEPEEVYEFKIEEGE